jgi:hypothetical protein
MNITYLFGAGASAKACPILKGQGETMIALSKMFLDPEIIQPNFKLISSENPGEVIMHDMWYFGQKALQYGTIDTYAKKLFLSDDYEHELDRLKLSVSTFFTIWESMNNDHPIKAKYENIDSRYISLLASVLERTPERVPKIKDNIRFVTWNYDLQFERAFKSFCMNHFTWNEVSRYLKFRVDSNQNSDLDICHLNGYNGYYLTAPKSDKQIKEVDTIDRDLQDKDLPDMLKEIDFIVESNKRKQISFSDHINYAWESNSLAQATRNTAINIFSKTDTLIIIGYSFPPFNKEIDQLLFKSFQGTNKRIFYQDPNASEEYISTLIKGPSPEIHCITDKLDQFMLPYDF